MVKYLFYYLRTGGGHLAPAKAVAEQIKHKTEGKIEIILADGLSGSNKLIKTIIEDGYKRSVDKAVWVYELLYALHKVKIISRLTTFIISGYLKPGLEKQILLQRPEKIVIFHFFIIKPVFEIVRRHNLDIQIITVVTDPFTAHPVWFIQKGQRFIVFSEVLKEKCIKSGISAEAIKVFPLVLDRRFSGKTSNSRAFGIRKKLGFKRDSKVILILGGGDGMPHGKKILKSIITKNIDAEIAVVCGNNREMYNHVIGLKRKYQVDDLKVYRFVDFIHSLISISDLVITKCGASTFMEILLMGKIPVINNYIWEQEKGNMEFVVSSKMGIFEKSTKKLPDVVSRLLNDDELYNSFRKNINDASLSNGLNKVSEYILTYQN